MTLILALIAVESNGNDNAIGDDGLAHLNELSCEMMWTIAGDGRAVYLLRSSGPLQQNT